MSEPTKIEGLLESVSTSLGKIDELERAYNEARGDLISGLASHINQLAVLSDSQAARAQVVRKLYWNKRIPVELIAKAFGLKPRAVTKIAGALVLTLPCPSECGNSVKREFKSRSQLDDYYRSARRCGRLSYPTHLACEECKRKAESEREAEAARQRQRNIELLNMPWEEFAETKEWVAIRNDQLHYADYECERCHTRGVGLYVYLGDDTPQNYPYFSNGTYQYYVLCRSCVPMCGDLINAEKSEYVKLEFVQRIRDSNQGHYPDVEGPM